MKNGEFNEYIKSANTRAINSKTELSEVNETTSESVTENIKEDKIVSTNYCETINDKNNHANKNYDLLSTNDNSAMPDYEINSTNSSKHNASFTNFNKLIEFEKLKNKIHQFFQNVETELKKCYNCLNVEPTIKYVAHLETEASKKKELLIVVEEFEKKRINSPNPFLFVEELMNTIHEFDQLK